MRIAIGLGMFTVMCTVAGCAPSPPCEPSIISGIQLGDTVVVQGADSVAVQGGNALMVRRALSAGTAAAGPAPDIVLTFPGAVTLRRESAAAGAPIRVIIERRP